MEQEILTLNWANGRTLNESEIREYFEIRGWASSGDDIHKDDVSFRLVDFGKANCLNFVSPLEKLPREVYEFIINLPDSPTITWGVGDEHETEIMNTWTWMEFVEIINGVVDE